MVKQEVTSVLISQFVFDKLPEDEKAKFEKYKEYTPEFIEKEATYPDEDEYMHFEDEVFDSIELMENFFGEDWGLKGTIYKKDYLGFGESDEEYFEELAEDLDGEHFGGWDLDLDEYGTLY